MAYTKTTWVNDQAPDIDADNLNKIETGIYNAHTSLNSKANQSTLATVESSSSASKAYTVGSYLVYNGILYRVTSAISSGQTLTPGTNITATNAGAELKSLNSSVTSLNSDVTSLNNDLTSLMVYKVYSYDYTIGANDYLSLTAANFNITTVDGYTIAAVRSYQTGNSNVLVYASNPGNSSGVMRLRNISSSSISATATIIILYAKSSTINVI